MLRKIHLPSGGQAARIRRLLIGSLAAFVFLWLLSLSRLELLHYTTIFQYDVLAPIHDLVPTIYNNIHDMPSMTSSGPWHVNPHIGGLYEFNNVCLTKHFRPGDLQGLIYFMPNNETLMKNPLRCAPCSAPLNHEGGWNGTGRDEEVVGHRCGFHSTHLMYSSSVADWSECVSQPEVQEQMEVWAQVQIPSRADAVRLYEEPVFALNFPDNIGHSLFDQLLTYLPHWYEFREQNHFPFRGVLSHSIEGCLSDGNTAWFCEILRAMRAFGDAKELPPKPSNTTLSCFRSLFITEIASQRSLSNDKVLPKTIFDSLRDILFQKLNLERNRNYHHEVQMEGEHAQNQTKILFYAHKPSGRRVWNGMDALVKSLNSQSKYRGVEFQTIQDFGAHSMAQQASLFNTADAHIMVHGAQMVNSIFSVDGSLFLELGCAIPTFIGNPKFMALIDGHHKSVEQCGDDSQDNEICVVCDSNFDIYGNFTMKSAAFQAMVDEVLHDLNHSF